MYFFFFFNHTPPTEIYTFPYTTLFRSHHAGQHANPVIAAGHFERHVEAGALLAGMLDRRFDSRTIFRREQRKDRKSTRLNSSHPSISYAVFCLKKKINILQSHNEPPAI